MGNLPEHYTEEDLRKIFCQYGTVSAGAVLVCVRGCVRTAYREVNMQGRQARLYVEGARVGLQPGGGGRRPWTWHDGPHSCTYRSPSPDSLLLLAPRPYLLQPAPP